MDLGFAYQSTMNVAPESSYAYTAQALRHTKADASQLSTEASCKLLLLREVEIQQLQLYPQAEDTLRALDLWDEAGEV